MQTGNITKEDQSFRGQERQNRLSQETIDRLQGNYKSFIGDILDPKQVSDSYKAARHIQSAQKITTDTAKVSLDLPKDGVVVLTTAEYLKLAQVEDEVEQKVKKAVGLYENAMKQISKMFAVMAKNGITVDGVYFLTAPFDNNKKLDLLIANNLTSYGQHDVKLLFRYEK